MASEGKTGNPQAVRQCVQCLMQYKEEENVDDSCKFHLLSAWGYKYQCCNRRTNEAGCVSKRHRSQHHTDWRYGEYLKLVSSILNYTDKRKEWAKIEAQDLEKNNKLNATIGWILTKAGNWKNHLYIKLNSYWNFLPFSMDYIKNYASNKTDTADSNRALIKEYIDEDTEAVIKAEWALTEKTNNICGVYLSIKTKTSSKIECILVKFSVDGKGKILNFDGTEEISKGGFTEYRPSKLYHDLIEDKGIIFEGAEFIQDYDAKEVEKKKKSIKGKSYGPLTSKLAITQKVFKCNDRFSYSGDKLILEIQFMNKTKEDDFVFTEVSGIYQLLGDENWSDLNNNGSKLTVKKYKTESSYYLNETESIPFNIEKGRGTTQLIQLEIFLPFEFEQQPKPSFAWYNRSFLARHRPINLKFKFKDIDEEIIIFETQFITDLYGYNDNENTVFSMPIQDCLTFDFWKYYIEFEKMEKRNPIQTTADDEKSGGGDVRWSNFDKLMIKGNNSYNSYDISDLRSMVYKAMKENKSIIKLDTDNLTQKDKVQYNAYGYIDRECQRLYAIKMILTTKSCKKSGLFILPIYGTIFNVEEKNPVIVSTDDEQKYFAEKENKLDVFKMDEIVEKYYDIQGSEHNFGDILIQKRTKREIDIRDFGQGFGGNDEKENGGGGYKGNNNEIAMLSKKIEEQSKIIAVLQKQLKGGSNGGDYKNDAVAQWANNLGDKFEEIAKLFKAFPGN